MKSQNEVAQEGIEEKAAHFVTRLYSGELNTQEELAIECWRKENPAHETAFQTMLALWDLSSNLYQQPVAEPKRSLAARVRSWGLSAAAGVLLSTGLYYMVHEQLFASRDAEPQPVVQVVPKQVQPAVQQVKQEHRYLHTGLGEVDTVELSDGSTVTLNTNTSLQIAFNARERFVVLVEGEAFFDVESDVTRPFVIDTGEQEIRVLGTKFNVRKEDSGVRVAVLEGKVAVTRMSSLSAADIMNDADVMVYEAKDYLLEAGAIGSFSATADVVAKTSLSHVTEAQSWRRGIFRFDDATLADVVKEFNRYRSQKIVIADEGAGELRISGVFHFEEGEGLLKALTASLPIEVDTQNEEILLRKK